MSYNTIFVTVGTTKFEELIKVMDTESFFSTIRKLGCKKLIIQKGRGETMPNLLLSKQFAFFQCHLQLNVFSISLFICRSPAFSIEVFGLKPSLLPYMTSSDLVISHCGAGTISEVLKLKKPLIVVVNETLMGNHQSELAEVLAEQGCLLSAVCSTLVEKLELLPSTKFNPIPKPKTELFGQYLLEVVCQ